MAKLIRRGVELVLSSSFFYVINIFRNKDLNAFLYSATPLYEHLPAILTFTAQ